MDKPRFFSGLAFLAIGFLIVKFGLLPLGFNPISLLTVAWSQFDSIESEFRVVIEMFIAIAVLMFVSGFWFIGSSFKKR
jgi:hypothetical protein